MGNMYLYVLSSETCPQITWRATRNFFQFLQWFIIKGKAIDIEIAFNSIFLSHAAIFCVSLIKKLKKNLIQKRQKNNLLTFFKRNMLCYTREWEKKVIEPCRILHPTVSVNDLHLTDSDTTSLAKGQVKSEWIYEIVHFPNYQLKNLKDFCPEKLFEV